MVLRTAALLVAVLLLASIGGASPAAAQRQAPDTTDAPWWWEDDSQSATQDEDPVEDESLQPGGVDPEQPLPESFGDDEPEEEQQDDGTGLPEIVVPTTRTVAGKVAYVRRDGKAAIPRDAPKRVRQLIAAANQIVGKPYKWGGGHAKLVDRGYDCSGTVSYALIRTGLLRSPLVSGALARWGTRGAGRWISVYANRGHVYLEVAGLRLDTSSVGDRGGRKGVRWRPVIGKRSGFTARHPAGL